MDKIDLNQQSYIDLKNNIINRLNRIEGQIRGIKKMVEQDKECTKILEQMSSVRASIDSVGLLFVGCSLHNQIEEKIKSGLSKEVVITETMKPFLKRFFE
ncbi:MAG: metal-sensitive transcriptional regulator [Cyanobacteriota bacterium]